MKNNNNIKIQLRNILKDYNFKIFYNQKRLKNNEVINQIVFLECKDNFNKIITNHYFNTNMFSIVCTNSYANYIKLKDYVKTVLKINNDNVTNYLYNILKDFYLND